MNNEKLNNLVLDYQQTKCDETFTELYEELPHFYKNPEKISQTIYSNDHEILAAYQDVLMNCINAYDGSMDFIHFYKTCVVRKRTDLYRKNKRRLQLEVYEEPTEGDEGTSLLAATIEQIADPNVDNDANIRKADQRQLIGILLDGEDETTTAIIKSYLANPKASNRSIAKQLNLTHQSQVSRTFKRLAGKFESKNIGDKTDFLTA